MENKIVEQVEQLKERVNNYRSIGIKRIPIKEYEWFVKTAEDDFCGDYGMLLKFLISDYLPVENQAIVSIIEKHEQEIQELKNKLLHLEIAKDEEKKTRVMGNGTTIVKR